jgi:hypothetical protein
MLPELGRRHTQSWLTGSQCGVLPEQSALVRHSLQSPEKQNGVADGHFSSRSPFVAFCVYEHWPAEQVDVVLQAGGELHSIVVPEHVLFVQRSFSVHASLSSQVALFSA